MEFARLPRILGAVIYDLFIVAAIIFVAAQWFPLVPETWQSNLLFTVFKQLYIIGISFLYFAVSWRRGGQTIGMKSWRIRLLNQLSDTEPASWRQCLVRYLVALLPWVAIGSVVILLFTSLGIPPGWNLGSTWLLFGLLYLMSTFSAKRGSLQDRISKTRLSLLPKKPKREVKAEGE